MTARARGYSLLEVLIAIAIVSFGMLAITSLEAALLRTSADAKARSAALSVAKDRIERLRAFRTLADYRALADIPEQDAVLPGGVIYRVDTVVERFAYATATRGFEAIADDRGDLPPGYAPDNEFKRIAVTVSWPDASGSVQRVVLDDAIAASAPENSGRVGRRANAPRRIDAPLAAR